MKRDFPRSNVFFWQGTIFSVNKFILALKKMSCFRGLFKKSRFSEMTFVVKHKNFIRTFLLKVGVFVLENKEMKWERKCVCVCVCVHECACVCICVYLCVFVCICVYLCAWI